MANDYKEPEKEGKEESENEKDEGGRETGELSLIFDKPYTPNSKELFRRTEELEMGMLRNSHGGCI